MENNPPFFDQQPSEIESFLTKNPPKEKLTSKEVQTIDLLQR